MSVKTNPAAIRIDPIRDDKGEAVTLVYSTNPTPSGTPIDSDYPKLGTRDPSGLGAW